MTDTITSRQFSDGISWLFNGDEVVFPYGKRPGSFIGGPTDWGGMWRAANLSLQRNPNGTHTNGTRRSIGL